MEYKERIKKIREVLFNGSNKEFAKAISENPNTTSNWISGKRNIALDVLTKISENLPQINKSWLFTGEGDMLKESNRVNLSDVIPNDVTMSREVFDLLKTQSETILSQQRAIEKLADSGREKTGTADTV